MSIPTVIHNVVTKEHSISPQEHENNLDAMIGHFIDHMERQGCEYGGWGLDDKRPFGNSDATGDICELLGLNPEHDENRKYADTVYTELRVHMRKRWKEYQESQTSLDQADAQIEALKQEVKRLGILVEQCDTLHGRRGGGFPIP